MVQIVIGDDCCPSYYDGGTILSVCPTTFVPAVAKANQALPECAKPRSARRKGSRLPPAPVKTELTRRRRRLKKRKNNIEYGISNI